MAGLRTSKDEMGVRVSCRTPDFSAPFSVGSSHISVVYITSDNARCSTPSFCACCFPPGRGHACGRGGLPVAVRCRPLAARPARNRRRICTSLSIMHGHAARHVSFGCSGSNGPVGWNCAPYLYSLLSTQRLQPRCYQIGLGSTGLCLLRR